MRIKVLSVVAAAALLASVGVTHAKDPVTLTDGQLDKVTAGDSASSQTAALLADSTAELNNLLAISSFTLKFLSGMPVFTLPATTLPTVPIAP